MWLLLNACASTERRGESMRMDPQIAVQVLLTIAKISGTMLAIFMAVIIFSLRDESLARLILLRKPRGGAPLFTLLTTCFLFGLEIIGSLFLASQVNLGESYGDAEMLGSLVAFSVSIALMFAVFGMLLLEKRDFLKESEHAH